MVSVVGAVTVTVNDGDDVGDSELVREPVDDDVPTANVDVLAALRDDDEEGLNEAVAQLLNEARADLDTDIVVVKVRNDDSVLESVELEDAQALVEGVPDEDKDARGDFDADPEMVEEREIKPV